MKNKTEKTEKKQGKHLFKKGESGNPNGRPKDTFSLVTILKQELKKIAKEGGNKTMAQLFIQRVLHKAVIEGDVAMMKDILNRVDGMPKITADLTSDGEKLTTVVYVPNNGRPNDNN